jgi:hypothetical protein
MAALNSRVRNPPSPAPLAALALAGVELCGLHLLGWSPMTVLLVLLADDLWCAVGTWLRTAWARTRAGEGPGERLIAIGGHALLDLLTVGALLVAVLLLPVDAPGAGIAWDGLPTALAAGAAIALVSLGLGLRRDRAGVLADIDAIRREARVLTRFLLYAVACTVAMPWLVTESAPAQAAATGLVLLRTAWVVWLGRAELVHRPEPAAPAPGGRRD